MSIGQQRLAAVVLRRLVLRRAPGRARPARWAGPPRTSGRSRRPRGGSGRGRRAGRRAVGTPSRGPRPARRRGRRARSAVGRLRRGQPARPGAGDLLERGRQRLDRARGRGRWPSPPRPRPARSRRIASPSSRIEVRTGTAWVTSLAPMKMTATCGSTGSTRSTWPCEVLGLGADLRHRRSGRPGGPRPRRRRRPGMAPGVSSTVVDAVAGRGRVADQGDLERRPGTTVAVPAGRGRRVALGVADGAAGELGLGAQDAPDGAADHGEAAPAVARRAAWPFHPWSRGHCTNAGPTQRPPVRSPSAINASRGVFA